MFTRRDIIGSCAVIGSLGGVAAVAAVASGGVLTPEMFGAKGDGVSNDSAAFAALADRVNAAGGGTIRFRRATYLVGGQRPGLREEDWAFDPVELLAFRGCVRPLLIQGNGATIRCAPGLLYGTFDRRSGAPTKRPMPNLDKRELASPYRFMIAAEGCTGPVIISDLELDGNLTKLRIGGPYGDTGWQIPATGIFLRNNSGNEIIRNVYSHHHPQDGLMIDGNDDERLAGRVSRLVENFRSEYNGRQGCSLVGGRRYRFSKCAFNHTGKAGLSSAPGAGVDIEAEGGKINRDFLFENCEFVNNSGCGLVADSGDSEGASFVSCKFIGTTSWSAWPFKSRFRFEKCSFVGSLVKIYGDADPRKANQFYDCTFRDDPALSPTRQVFVGGAGPATIADAAFGTNALFSRCEFILTHNGLLPWSWRAIYSNCKMQQKADVTANPKGKYLGYNTLSGNVSLYGTHVIGTLVANGKKHEKVQLGGTSW